tara:strand:+ start:3649 stop:3822 length:174 start_codon:yes stop_codon:yes gene_type:complete
MSSPEYIRYCTNLKEKEIIIKDIKKKKSNKKLLKQQKKKKSVDDYEIINKEEYNYYS